MVKDLVYGLAIGDALGVPVEFKNRKYLKNFPVTDMIGNGTYEQPKGTWSDDTSLALCIMDAMEKNSVDYSRIVQNFIKWKDKALFTASGIRFDIGNTTWEAIQNHKESHDIFQNGVLTSSSNGSLMRCSVLIFILKDLSFLERITITSRVNALTHGNLETFVCDFFLIEYLLELMENHDKDFAFEKTINSLMAFFYENGNDYEILKFLYNLKNLKNFPITQIKSTGYCVHTLEAALWCFLNNFTYKDTILAAVNLGEDTDTVAAIAGGISGLYYGFNAIPTDWVDSLVNKELLDKLINQVNNKING